MCVGTVLEITWEGGEGPTSSIVLQTVYGCRKKTPGSLITRWDFKEMRHILLYRLFSINWTHTSASSSGIMCWDPQSSFSHCISKSEFFNTAYCCNSINNLLLFLPASTERSKTWTGYTTATAEAAGAALPCAWGRLSSLAPDCDSGAWETRYMFACMWLRARGESSSLMMLLVNRGNVRWSATYRFKG